MKYLVNFKIPKQGYSEIVDIPSDKNSKLERDVAKEEATKYFQNRFSQDAVEGLKCEIDIIPMELERAENYGKED